MPLGYFRSFSKCNTIVIRYVGLRHIIVFIKTLYAINIIYLDPIIFINPIC